MSVVSCQLSVVSRKFVSRTTDHGPRTDCAMNEERGARSFASSPQPPTPNPRPRSGLSLTEVLIAMGILTLGLLGVASVFPVGSYYMQKAEISDKGSAIAQSVMNDIMARGMLNPRSWYVMV